MNEYNIRLPAGTAVFYEKVAKPAGRTTEQMPSDVLFKLAGELALEAPHKKGREKLTEDG